MDSSPLTMTIIIMIQYIALLRGINSGKNPNLKMEALKKAFEDMGFKNVKTIIASGNVVFEGPANNTSKLEEKIEKNFLKTFGYPSSTIVRTKEEIEEILKLADFDNAKLPPKSRPFVTFFKTNPVDKNFESGQGYKILLLNERAICYAIEMDGPRTPDLMAVLDKKFGKNITTRSLKTVEKILSKFE